MLKFKIIIFVFFFFHLDDIPISVLGSTIKKSVLGDMIEYKHGFFK